ncbi:unnamed protein product [Onchocerca flexuosa]|uniref:Uncharacterized protein n=1 Tax=Onchocerca flexuosa TaxID=387005 RepID=A0A183HHW2_9BILA|nr:unnamed protein product [Onchocerca flexuosa]
MFPRQSAVRINMFYAKTPRQINKVRSFNHKATCWRLGNERSPERA